MRRRSLSTMLLPLCFVLAAESLLTEPCAAGERSKIVSIEVEPPQLELSDIRDSRSVIVTGIGEDGLKYDLTGEATLKASGAQVKIDDDRFVVPVSAGDTTVLVSSAGHELTVRVAVKSVDPKPVSFVHEVIPVISRVGCNLGTCHGSQKGQAGFQLSLRGYDPLYDYRAFVDDLSGRRFNRSKPSQSLMLLKPTQGVPHEGGFLFDEESRYYKILHQWIAEGCSFEEAGRVTKIEVIPSKPSLQHSDDVQQLIVIAHYPDGSTHDVTREAVYESSDFEIATVTDTGRIKAIRRGEAAALVRYEGQYAAAPVTVIGDREGYEWNDSPEFNFVDAHINRKLKLIKVLPSELCTDAEFFRRISLDLTGVPPTAESTRAFLTRSADSKTKRAEVAEEMLASPEFVDHWTLKWSDLLMSNRKYIKEKGVWAFRNWIRNSIARNKPYDEFVTELLTANGSTFSNPAANYFRIAREPRVVMENMTQVFLGTRFQCNRCHDHPFERWTQQQYYELSAFFSSVGRKGGIGNEEIIFTLDQPQPIKHPGTGQTIPAVFPFEHAGMDEALTKGRPQLAQWLTSPKNPYFAKSIVNRYWSYFTGRGIIDPVDDIRASNPPSNPEFLAALTDDFVANGFDLKRLVRTIISSHTYQRSYRPNEWNRDDTINFSHAAPRRLAAEQLFDSIMVAAGCPTSIPGAPSGFRAAQLPDPALSITFLDMFGRAPRESPCECERSSQVSLGQTLNLVNGPTIADAIIHPKGLIARLVAQQSDRKTLIDEVYLSVVCRFPTDEEAQRADAFMNEVGNDTEAIQDLMWALINSPAFLFNR